jgi:DNA-binding IclR family transcriptional regulator
MHFVLGGTTRLGPKGRAVSLTIHTPDSTEQSGSRYQVRAVHRTVELLQAVAEDNGRGKTLSGLAQRAGMPEPSALRYLATLVQRGLVEYEGSREQGRYRPGLGLFALSEHAIGHPDIRALSLPYMQPLLERYQETVNLAVFRQRRLVIVEVLQGTRSIRLGARVGEQDRLRSSALGKAILATLPDAEVLALLHEEPLGRFTPRTITTDCNMLKEIHTIRARGYAIDEEESEVGLRCVGVAIPGRFGQTFSLSISGPSHLFSGDAIGQAGAVLCDVKQKLAVRLNNL